MREERKKLGYAQEYQPEYVFLAYEGEEQRNKAIAMINQADVVIAGSAPNEMLVQRIRQKKLLFRYSERPFKKKVFFLKLIYHAICHRQRDLFQKNVYMLCASAYAASDYETIRLYRNRTYKWGYFPCVKNHDIDVLFSKKKKNVIMWCGRFIDWKHPDDAVMVAKKLKENGYQFHLNFVGTGIMEEKLIQLVKELNLSDYVSFLGSMPPEQVRSYMEEAGVYLFTSDRQEGWGAVLNEAMNSGCTVVASHAIGSVPYLIENEKNGIIYESGNIDMLYDKIKYVLENPDKQYNYGREAYETIVNEWNAKVAADRILILAEKLLLEECTDLFKTGPCSRA